MIHQMKGNIFVHLLVTVILKLDMEVKSSIRKPDFFTFIFQTCISPLYNTVSGNLKLLLYVHNIHVQGTVSQILFNVLDFILRKKTGNFLVNILNIFSTFHRK